MKKQTKCSVNKTLVGREESAGAVIQRCSVNRCFDTCAGVSFNEVSGLETCNVAKK